MLFLALQAAPQTGKRPVLLAARNAHKALLYAAALLDFDVEWLWPAPEDSGALCSCPVPAAKLADALHALAQQDRKPFGVYVTSPDYLGGVQDIAALAAVCRAQDVPLLVDNAHGAYLRFLPENRLCGIARNIGRAGESCRMLTLGELREAEVDMFCTVLIGNAMTKTIGGRLITPRGYKNV